jgi:hypothetical protein
MQHWRRTFVTKCEAAQLLVIGICLETNGTSNFHTRNDNLPALNKWRRTLRTPSGFLVNHMKQRLFSYSDETFNTYANGNFFDARVYVQDAIVSGTDNILVLQNHELRFECIDNRDGVINRAQH